MLATLSGELTILISLTVPIFRVSREIGTDDFDALYAELKPKGVTVSAMLAKACAMAMEKYPIINAAYVPGGIKYILGPMAVGPSPGAHLLSARSTACDGGRLYRCRLLCRRALVVVLALERRAE